MQAIPEIGDYKYYNGRRGNDWLMRLCDTKTLTYVKSRKQYTRYCFDNLLNCMVKDMRERITQHYDNLVMINGKVGTGKSTLAYAAAKLYDPQFDLEDGYIYDWGQLIDKAADGDIQSGRAYILDEGTRISNNRKGMTKSGRNFIEFLETNRFKEATFFYVIPKFARADSYLKSDRVTHRLITKSLAWDHATVKSRGYFKGKIPIDSDLDDDSTDYMDWKDLGYGKFPELPPEIKKIYDRLKSDNVDDQNRSMRDEYHYEKEKERKTDNKAALEEQIWQLHCEGASALDIAAATGLAYGTVRNKLSVLKRQHAGEDENVTETTD